MLHVSSLLRLFTGSGAVHSMLPSSFPPYSHAVEGPEDFLAPPLRTPNSMNQRDFYGYKVARN